jgi:hypothetical protein
MGEILTEYSLCPRCGGRFEPRCRRCDHCSESASPGGRRFAVELWACRPDRHSPGAVLYTPPWSLGPTPR